MKIVYVVEFETIDSNSMNAFNKRQMSKDDYESLLASNDKVEWINKRYAFEWALENRYCTAFFDQWLVDEDNKYSKIDMKFSEEERDNLERLAAQRGGRKIDLNNGAGGMSMHKRNYTGAFTPQPGYYLIKEVPSFELYADTGESVNGGNIAELSSRAENRIDHRVIHNPVYASYRADSFDSFTDEIVLIEGKFLYNKRSIGLKHIRLRPEMILHVSDVKLVDAVYQDNPYKTYSVSWNIINLPNHVISKHHACNEGKGYTSQDLDDMYRGAFDGNSDAVWNVD